MCLCNWELEIWVLSHTDPGPALDCIDRDPYAANKLNTELHSFKHCTSIRWSHIKLCARVERNYPFYPFNAPVYMHREQSSCLNFSFLSGWTKCAGQLKRCQLITVPWLYARNFISGNYFRCAARWDGIEIERICKWIWNIMLL